MLRIGICDDMPEMCDIFRAQLLKGNYTTQPFEISIFHSAQEILDTLPKLDLLFLDIEMPEMSGMELMRQHGALFEDTNVVFLTAHSKFVYDGYKVKAYRFLHKPAEDFELREIFQSMEKEEILNTSLSLPVPHMNTVCVRLKDIIYIESRINYSYVVTTKGTLKCSMRLKDILPKLPDSYFYTPHRSYIVNMRHVIFVFRKERRILMSNEAYVDISYRKLADCIDFFMTFQRR